MRNVLASATVISVALALFSGVILYGAVDPDVAAPMYGFGLLAGVFWAQGAASAARTKVADGG